MRIDQELSDDGRAIDVDLLRDGDHLALHREGTLRARFSESIVLGVVRRYGRPLAPEMEPHGERLPLSAGRALLAWHYRAPVDLESKLYLVLQEPDGDSVAVLGRQVASALEFLARRAPQPAS